MRALARTWREIPGVDQAASVLIVLCPVLVIFGLVGAARSLGAAAIEPVLGAVALLFAFSVQDRTTATVYAFAAGWLIHG